VRRPRATDKSPSRTFETRGRSMTNPQTRLSPSLKKLAWSNLAAQSADQIGLAAAPMLAVAAFHAQADATAWLQTAQTLPFLLFAIPAGFLADRMLRQRLMAMAECLRVGALLAVPLLAMLQALNLFELAVLGFVGACGTVAYSVSAPALVPALAPPAALAAANGRIELARSVAFAAGPALAGTLVGWIGSSLAYAIAAALSFGAVILLVGINEPARAATPAREPLYELREAIGFAICHSFLRAILLTAVFFNVAFFMLQAVYVPYAVHRLGLSMAEVGATLATYGVGMVAAAAAAPRLVRRLPFGASMVIGPAAGLVASLVMVLTLRIPSIALAGLSFFLIGAGPILWVISSTTLRQVVTPVAMLGRVSALVTTATFGARPIGSAIAALIATSHGPEACIVLAAGGFMVQLAIIVCSPVAKLAALPQGHDDPIDAAALGQPRPGTAGPRLQG
jgi:predicted MFS family arabinose efflux permease